MHCENKQYETSGNCPVCKMKLIATTRSATSEASTQKPFTICFYLQDNVEVLDFAGPLEVFTAAGFNVFTVSKTQKPIHSQGVLTVVPEFSIENAPAANMMVFFGGGHGSPSTDPAVINWIKSRVNTTDYFMSVCTGAFIMGRAGILDGLSATCYQAQLDNLQKALPKTTVLRGVRVVDNGRVLSTAGVSAGIDGAIYFVSKVKGEAYGQYVADLIEYDKYAPNEGLVIAKNEQTRPQ